ncbi:MAG: hypothetical protein V4465_02300 [Patescibacteria group bacterium]
MYTFALLRTDRTDEARAYNEPFLGPHTRGVELTTKPFIRSCGLSNIDPQHKPGGGSSVIEDALGEPFWPENTIFVTQRPDKDAIGYMAIQQARALGLESKLNLDLIRWAGAADRLGARTAAREYPELEERFREVPYLGALNIIAWKHSLFRKIEERVLATMHVLCGMVSDVHIMQFARQAPLFTRQEFRPEIKGEVAYLEAPNFYKEARGWLGSRSRVGVVLDPTYWSQNGGVSRRITVIFSQEPVYRWELQAKINLIQAEARGMSVTELEDEGLDWGGGPRLLSAPEGFGRGTNLSGREVFSLVSQMHEASHEVK